METLLNKKGVNDFEGNGGLVLSREYSCHYGVACPSCKSRHDIRPSVVLATVNPNEIPCQHCDFIIKVEWR